MPESSPAPPVIPALLNTLRHSILARIGLAMVVLATLSFLSVLISTVIADSSVGKASAINLSGSLRMTSYRLLSELQQADRRPFAGQTLEQFERRLETLERAVAGHTGSALDQLLAQVRHRWEEEIRPLARVATAPEGSASPEAIQQLAQDIPGFVNRIDEVVQLIELDLEERIRLLRATQFALLGLMVVVSLITTWMLRTLLFRPLADLLKAARSVTAGSFGTRVRHTAPDELGQLGQAFNAMMDEIASMYGQLEAKVAQKTEALTRTNQSLELLYRTSQQLSSGDLGLETIHQVLREIEEALELGHNAICISEHGQFPAQQVVGSLSPGENLRLRAERDCATCFHQATLAPEQQTGRTADGRQMIVFPLGGDESLHGVMPVMLDSAMPLPRDKLRTLETVSRQISNALVNMRRTEERHRLAVLEERAVIARELHDSIAQSLSYLKIQVTRLEKHLGDNPQATPIAEELKVGLNAAYRELRELITTFRLRLDERGFSAALQETVEEFSRKCGFTIALDNRLSGIVLTANEEMHVIRIIREALANIEKHAKASSAGIEIGLDDDRRVRVCVRDNGRGFNPETPPRNHYGLIIMRDRAQILDGSVELVSPPEGGTLVCLGFRPEQFSAKENR